MAIHIPPELVLEKEVLSRIKSNRNWVTCVVGPTGSGKSYTAIKIGCVINPNFSAEDIVFNVKDFLTRFKELQKLPNEGIGSIIVFDEAEQDFSSRRSMSNTNVEFSSILSMLRFSRISVAFTLPNLNMIDLNARRLFHHLLMTVEVDRTSCERWKKTRSGVKIYRVIQTQNPNDKESEFRSMFPVITVPVKNRKTGTIYEEDCRVKQLWFTLAPKNILDVYERRKKAYFDKTMNEATAKIEFKERKEKNKMGSSGIETQQTIQTNPTASITPESQVISNNTISNILNDD